MTEDPKPTAEATERKDIKTSANALLAMLIVAMGIQTGQSITGNIFFVNPYEIPILFLVEFSMFVIVYCMQKHFKE